VENMSRVESYTNNELIIGTDENKLVKLNLVINEHEDTVVYSEFINNEWVEYPIVFAKDLLNVSNPFGVDFEGEMTIDYITCHYFNHWYKNILGK
jgi:hypothetical protein